MLFRRYLRQFIAERYATRASGFFIGGLCVALNLSEMDLRPTDPNYLTDEELMAITAGADRTNEAV